MLLLEDIVWRAVFPHFRFLCYKAAGCIFRLNGLCDSSIDLITQLSAIKQISVFPNVSNYWFKYRK